MGVSQLKEKNGRKGSIEVVDHTSTVENILSDGTFYVFEDNIGDNNYIRR